MRERPSSAELSSFFSCRSGVYWKNFHEVKKTKKKRDEKVEDQRAIGTVSLNWLSQYQITNAFPNGFFMLAEITSENIREKIKESFNCVTKLCIEIEDS